ncbi:MAG: GGDEF domain-containing protein [Armatimonadota bacterium]|jgi:diguanylate cyclase (GGDEF)-like protein
MNHPARQPWEEDLFTPQDAEDVLERLAGATDVLDLLRRTDEVTPPEINLWGALILGAPESAEARLYVHSPAPLTPALALALADSMYDELASCCSSVPELARVRNAGISCADIRSEVMNRFCDAFHDRLTRRGPDPVGVTRAAASVSDGLTLQRWRQADAALEITAWMVGALTGDDRERCSVRDPISGQYSREFFEQTLHNELARHQRAATELSVILLQLRRSTRMMADERPSPLVLATTGGLMRHELREADIVARIDGRRMVAMLPCTSPRNGLIAASRLGEALADAAELEGWSIDIGVSGMGMETVGAAELLDQATHAMLSASRGSSGYPFVYV